MPTGHTDPVINGEITTVEEFAAECASSFSLSVRDGVLAFPSEHDEYHERGLREAFASLDEWDSLDEAGRYAAWSTYVDELHTLAAKETARAQSANDKCLALRNKVNRVAVPESLAAFKKFMTDQLTMTMLSDGRFDSEHYTPENYSTWVDSRRGDLIHDITYHAKKLEEHAERVQKNKAWISTLASTYGLEVED